jgi:acyl-CoA thioester hydrolase
MNQPADHRASPRDGDTERPGVPQPHGSGATAHHQQRMRVAWADTDASGRIHCTAAFRWAETAEHALLRRLGLHPPGNADGFPRRHVEATYHKALRFADEFDLVLCAERLGRTSVTYAWQAVRDGEVCVEGRTVVVHVDGDGTPVPLPQALRGLGF